MRGKGQGRGGDEREGTREGSGKPARYSVNYGQTATLCWLNRFIFFDVKKQHFILKYNHRPQKYNLFGVIFGSIAVFFKITI